MVSEAIELETVDAPADIAEEQAVSAPDVLFMGESLDKIKIAFRNEIIAPALVLNDYTVVSFSLRDFAKTCGMLRGVLKGLVKTK